MAMLRPMARSFVVGAACYVKDTGASRLPPLPAYCHKPAARAPDCAGASARKRGLMAPMNHARRTAMTDESRERDPNAELRSFEPLRVSLAIGALLLGVILGFH
jgi:hypothetical protein